MPELQIERREQPAVPVWLWVIAALLLAAVLWWFFAGSGNRPSAGVGETPGSAQTTTGTAGDTLPLSAIIANPGNYFGQSVSGFADVATVNSDRGFWVETAGQKLYAVLDDSIPEYPPDVNAGQTLQIQATVRDPAKLDELPVKKLEVDARQSLTGQPAFLHVQKIDILSR